jgi:hypothetical protein
MGMEGILSFAIRMTVLAVLTMTAEFLVPEGRIKGTVCVSCGLVFLSAAMDQILVIIAGMGV